MSIERLQNKSVVKQIDIDSYLERLELQKELPSLDFLKKIHRNHQIVFPFENLDIHFKRKITLEIDSIYFKLINRKRGGFCYELNLAFYHLLVNLGYDCHLISAQVWNHTDKKYGPKYDHMALLVYIKEEIYLCDVGYGGQDSFIFPKKVKEELQIDFNRYFLVTKNVDGIFFLKKSENGVTFDVVYKFSAKIRESIEFLSMCRFQQNAAESSLVGRKIMTKLTKNGRIKLTDNKLIILEKGEIVEESLLNEDAFYVKMEEYFGISYHSLLQG